MTTIDNTATVEHVRDSRDALATAVRHGLDSADLAELYGVLGYLDVIAYETRGMAIRLARRCDEIATCPELRVDELGEPVDPASVADATATACLIAERTLDTAQESLHIAHNYLSRLYLEQDGHRR